MWRGGLFGCVSSYPRIHFRIYLKHYLWRDGLFDCVSSYQTTSEEQLQNGRVIFTRHVLSLGNCFHAMFTSSHDLCHNRMITKYQNTLVEIGREEWRRSITIYPSLPMSLYNEGKYYETSKDHRDRNFPVTKRSTPLLCKIFPPSHPTPAHPSWQASSLTSSTHCLGAAWIFLLVVQAFYRARERSLDVDYSWEALEAVAC